MEEKKKNQLFMGIGTGILIISYVIYIIAYIKQTTEELAEGFFIFTAIFTTLWALVTTIIFFVLMKDFTFQNPSGKVWLWLGLGIGAFALGELLWTIYTVIGEDPFPSIADIFYLLGYPLLFFGLIKQVNLNKVEIPIKEKNVILTITLAVTILSFVIMILPIIQSYDAEELTFLELVITVLYPILDIILTPIAFIIFFKFKGGEFGKSWFLISLGFIIMIAADLVYGFEAYLVWDNAFFIYDQLYNLSYFLYAIGALQIHASLKSI